MGGASQPGTEKRRPADWRLEGEAGADTHAGWPCRGPRPRPDSGFSGHLLSGGTPLPSLPQTTVNHHQHMRGREKAGGDSEREKETASGAQARPTSFLAPGSI